MIRLTSALAFVAVFAVGMPLQAANIAGNPGFEIEGAGGPTDSDLWTATGGGPAGTLSERDSSNPFAGQSAQNLVAIGDDTAGASAGINQNSISDVGLASLQPGTTLQASFEWNSTYGPGGVGNGDTSDSQQCWCDRSKRPIQHRRLERFLRDSDIAAVDCASFWSGP